MSVAVFDVAQFANLVASVAPVYREAMAYLLAKVSRANVAAFAYSYPHDAGRARSATYDQILEMADEITVHTDLAISTLGLLQYNTIANDGRAFMDHATASQLGMLRQVFDAR